MQEYSADKINNRFDRKFLVFLGRYWAVIFLVVETIIFSFLARGFLTLRGIQIVFSSERQFFFWVQQKLL